MTLKKNVINVTSKYDSIEQFRLHFSQLEFYTLKFDLICHNRGFYFSQKCGFICNNCDFSQCDYFTQVLYFSLLQLYICYKTI